MARVLRIGVDTGGTFTDLFAVLPDGRLRAVKLPSTPADPALAVLQGLDLLLADGAGQAPAASPAPGPAPSTISARPGEPGDGVPTPVGDSGSGAVVDGEASGSLRPSEVSGGLRAREASGSLRTREPSGSLRSANPAAPPALEIIHGTTVATNALLERKGGPVALCVTEGFEDLLVLGRQARPALYALQPRVPEPLCSDERSVGVGERLGPGGEVLRPLGVDELLRVRDRVAALGVASVAVVLLHSYASDAHEQALKAALAPLGLPVSLSSAVLPAHREYERASATVADAYVAPVVGGYLGRLGAALSARGAHLRVMQSTGGAIPAAEAAAAPARTVLSGPAAGVIGAAAVGAACGERRLITFDMGGTSTDVSLVDGEPALTSEAQVAGLPLPLPMLAVHTVGAGGGSLAFIDAGGALQVGPASAGAEPGPACYGRGGQQATLTDADLLLGRLSAARFCGGAVQLAPPLAARALEELARPLRLSPLEAAAGIVQVASAVLGRAVRKISVEQGHDPADLTLVPFGGAGALHAADLAQELGVRRVLVPPAPGLLCAYGALCARGVHERARTLLREASLAQQSGAVLAALRALRAQVEEDIERAGADPRGAQYAWAADLRYQGQSYELTIPGASDGGPAATAAADLVVRFHAAHEARYGFTLAGQPVDLVALRLRGVVPAPAASPALLGRLGRRGAVAGPLGEASLHFLDGGRLRAAAAPILDRAALRAGDELAGPALLVEYSATTLVPPGWRARCDDYGALLLTA